MWPSLVESVWCICIFVYPDVVMQKVYLTTLITGSIAICASVLMRLFHLHSRIPALVGYVLLTIAFMLLLIIVARKIPAGSSKINVNTCLIASCIFFFGGVPVRFFNHTAGRIIIGIGAAMMLVTLIIFAIALISVAKRKRA